MSLGRWTSRSLLAEGRPATHSFLSSLLLYPPNPRHSSDVLPVTSTVFVSVIGPELTNVQSLCVEEDGALLHSLEQPNVSTLSTTT